MISYTDSLIEKLPLQLRYVTYLFVSVALISRPILEKNNFIKNVYIVLSCLIKECSFLNFISIYFRTLAVLLVLGFVIFMPMYIHVTSDVNIQDDFLCIFNLIFVPEK